MSNRIAGLALVLVTLGVGAALLGCGDAEDPAGGGTTSSGTSEGGGDGGESGEGGPGGAGGEGGAGGAAPPDFAALVVGQLYTDDLEEAKAMHDALAAGGEAQAKAAGDFGHDALLGTALLGTTPGEFLGLDRWNDAAAMGAFYGNPEFQKAFLGLFAAPPTLEAFGRRPDWHGWGDLDSGDAYDPYFFVVVRGRLASGDLGAMRSLHDQIASGGEEAAKALGDVAHVVFLGLEDPRELLAVDIWSSDADIETLYGNPDFQAAFAQLFEGEASLRVYGSTDWHQW